MKKHYSQIRIPAILKFSRAFVFTRFIGLILIPAIFFGNQSSAANFDPEEFRIKTSDLWGEDVLVGQYHRVREEAINKGFMNQYVIESDFGEFDATSDEQLLIRINEVGAIAELQKITKSKVFADSMVNVAKAPVELVQTVAADPVGTIKGIPAGASRLFKRTSRQVKDATEKTTEFVQNQTTKSDEDGEGNGDDPDMVEKGMETGEQLSKSYLGYNTAIRKLAKELGVDPYSSNAVLQEEMGRLAWAMTAGSFATSKAMPSLPSELSTIGDINELVWDVDPLDLQLKNEELLKNMGISEELIKSLYDNKHYSTTMSNLLVGSVNKMSSAEGLEILIERAANAENRAQARIFVRLAETLGIYHVKQSPVIRIIDGFVLPLAQSEKGVLLFVVPIDYLVWTENASDTVNDMATKLQSTTGISHKELWVQGRISDLAREGMGALGWSLFDQSKSRL